MDENNKDLGFDFDDIDLDDFEQDEEDFEDTSEDIDDTPEDIDDTPGNIEDDVFADMNLTDDTIFDNSGVPEENEEQALNIDNMQQPEQTLNIDNMQQPEQTFENAADYMDGAIADDVDLHEDDAEQTFEARTDFISDSGNIVVQRNDTDEKGFSIVYVDIDKIAVTNRIRKMEPVDALVQSIKSTGLLEPLVVANTMAGDIYILLSGYRRLQACARAGKTRIPCIVNNNVDTPEIPILEAMYNHQKRYSVKEQIDYIDYLEKEKGIMNPAMIEYLLQMNNGDYTKLKDILNDNDDDIVSKLYDGIYDIATAFRKLEARRKKESREEKENKLAEGVYSDENSSGAEQIQGSGEEVDTAPLTEEQINALVINLENFDEDAAELDLTETVAADDSLKGFEDHAQKVGERECLDPAIRKAALIRDRGVCRCCGLGGPQMVNNLDAHHVTPVHLGGKDNVDNTVMLCLNCHRSVHLYATKDLAIDKALYKDRFDDLDEESKLLYKNEQIFENVKLTYKKIVKLGGQIRKGIEQQGLNREQYRKEHPNHDVGRRMPGKNGVQTTA